MPRFALLSHDSPRGPHYDFFLEAGDVLKTWALSQLPAAGVPLDCEELPDHRLLYLDYEGPISGDRGMVTRWDAGPYQIETWTADAVVVRVRGEKLVGRIALHRADESVRRWRLLLVSDNSQ